MKKFTVLCLALVFLLSFTGCGKSLPKEMPSDFEFSLSWGISGISSYDSSTGDLCKESNATNPEDYTVNVKLNDEEYALVWDMISGLDLDHYPDAPDLFDPGNGTSRPSETIRLCVTYGDYKKIILADGISLSHKTDDKLGKAFLEVCDAIINQLTASEEWSKLPEYEFMYE